MKNTLIRIMWLAVGIGLFACLSRMDAVFPPTGARMFLGFLVLTVYCCAFGPYAGGIVGGLGQTLYFLLYYDWNWDFLARLFPRILGPVLGVAWTGLILGALCLFTQKWENLALRLLLNLACAVIASAFGLWLSTSLVDTHALNQSLSMALRRNQNWFIANGAVLAAGVPLGMLLRPLLRWASPSSGEVSEQDGAENQWNERKDEDHGGL